MNSKKYHIFVICLTLALILSQFLFAPNSAKAEDKPDLIIENLTYGENNNLYAGYAFDGTMAYLRIQNQGSAAATDFEVGLYTMNADTNYLQCGPAMIVDTLGPGESKNIEFTHDSFFDCAKLENKEYYLKAYVDYNGKIEEYNEDNNTKTTANFIALPQSQAPQITNIVAENISDSQTKISFEVAGIVNPIVRWAGGQDFFLFQSNNKYKQQTSAINDGGNKYYAILSVSPSMTYHYRILFDANYNVTTNDLTFQSGVSDDTGFLYNIIVTSITKNSATIKWTTSRAANSQVEYVESGGSIYDIKGKKDTSYVTEHNVTLADLKPETLYKYALTSYDQQGNVYGTTSLSSSVLGLHFTTLSGSVSKPDLTIKNFKVSDLRQQNSSPWDFELGFDVENIGLAEPDKDFNLFVKNLTNNAVLYDKILDRSDFKPSGKVYVTGNVGTQFVAGENRIFMYVDDANVIAESNEGNNILVETFSANRIDPNPGPYDLQYTWWDGRTEEYFAYCDDRTDCVSSSEICYNSGTRPFFNKRYVCQSDNDHSVGKWYRCYKPEDVGRQVAGYKCYKIADNAYAWEMAGDDKEVMPDDGGSILINGGKEQKNIIEDNDGAKNNSSEDNSKGISSRLSGRLLLAVEDKGRIHYVSPDDQKRYEVTFGNVMQLFQQLALGITNNDINKILINPSSLDDDKDSDADGYSDKSEAMYGYNPEIASSAANRGNDKIQVDTNLSNRIIGKLLLQVEDRGRIWYVDQSAKRWEVTFGNVMNLFTSLALGINNADLGQIPEGN